MPKYFTIRDPARQESAGHLRLLVWARLLEAKPCEKEVKEGAIERERFQWQLEMLVKELEQKQVNTILLVLIRTVHIFM